MNQIKSSANEPSENASASSTYIQQFTQVGGHRMAYIDEGKGVPVLLIHGIPSSGLMWRKVIPVLSKHFRVVDTRVMTKSVIDSTRALGPPKKGSGPFSVTCDD